VYDLAGRTWLATFLNHWLAQPQAEQRVAV
jgi:hypothetical protein